MKRSDVKWAWVISPALYQNSGCFVFILTPDHKRVTYIVPE